MTEQELYNEYRKSDCKSFTDFLINKITELKKTYRKQRNKRIDELQKENAEMKEALKNGKVCKCSHYLNFKDLEAELTKAKEIIKKLIEAIHIWDCKNLEEVEAEAEQFLRDSEVEK